MRNDFIEKINEISARIHGNITDGKENLRIEYDPNIKIVNNLENELYNSIKNLSPAICVLEPLREGLIGTIYPSI